MNKNHYKPSNVAPQSVTFQAILKKTEYFFDFALKVYHFHYPGLTITILAYLQTAMSKKWFRNNTPVDRLYTCGSLVIDI